MSFNIHQLDRIEADGSYESEKAFEDYQDALLEQFINSPEGQARLEADPGIGFWAAQLIYYGYTYIGVTLPRMTVAHVDEIVTELFPRKISISSPDDADDAIPELIAFWEFLKREYKLSRANAILEFLRETEAGFRSIMNDPSKFGMAKSFFMMGQSAGFDMTNEKDANQFIAQYNASLIAQDPELRSSMLRDGLLGLISGASSSTKSRTASSKKKKLRKIAKASRKKNRKKR